MSSRDNETRVNTNMEFRRFCDKMPRHSETRLDEKSYLYRSTRHNPTRMQLPQGLEVLNRNRPVHNAAVSLYAFTDH